MYRVYFCFGHHLERFLEEFVTRGEAEAYVKSNPCPFEEGQFMIEGPEDRNK